MVPKGTAAREWYTMAMVLSTAAMEKHIMGKRVAVMTMVAIQDWPSLREYMLPLWTRSAVSASAEIRKCGKECKTEHPGRSDH